MTTIFVAAKYIAMRFRATYSPKCLTPMQLQKLLYYCQAHHLAKLGTPLFEEDFEAWPTGPVCPMLYVKMEETNPEYRPVIEEMFADISIIGEFSEQETQIMNEVLEKYGSKTPQQLCKLVCSEQPWLESHIDPETGGTMNCVIPKIKMRNYYGNLHNDIRVNSDNYKEQFQAEYAQLATRYDKLYRMLDNWKKHKINFEPQCPYSLYQLQLRAMKDYMTALEARACIENIDLADILVSCMSASSLSGKKD